MKKLIVFLIFTCSIVSAQTTWLELKSGKYGGKSTADTVSIPIMGVNSIDSLIFYGSFADSAKVVIDYRVRNGTLAIGSWTTIDSLTGTTNNGSTAPYGNLITSSKRMGARSTFLAPQIEFRIRFPVAGNTTISKSYSFGIIISRR